MACGGCGTWRPSCANCGGTNLTSSALAPDAVIASSPHPFVVLPARRIARKCSARLIFEVRDLWPLTLLHLSAMSRWHPFIQLLQWTENYAYRHADRVVSVLPKAADYMQAHGMKPEKFACVPNGICLEAWAHADGQLPEQHANELERLKKDGRFLVGYLGQHGVSNALGSFLAAGPLVRERALLVLVGQGPEKERLQAQAAAYGTDNIAFLPPVTKQTVPVMLASMDALFLGWNRQPLYRYGISPNKLMEYMMAEKPVIHAVEAANDPVAESGCGISCPPEDAGAVAAAILRLADCGTAERHAMGERGAQYVVAHNSYAALANEFLKVMETSEVKST